MSSEAMLATWELSKKDVTSLEKLLLLSLARRAGEDHTCWPSIKRIEEDTSMDRKTIVAYRQNLITKGFISYTGEMKGRTKLIPEMRLDYVAAWEIKRNSPRLKDECDSVDKSSDKKLNSTVDGTANSTVDGTANSTVDGTLNIKGEYKSGKKSSCPSDAKSRAQKLDNERKHDFSEKPKAPMADVTKQSTTFRPDVWDQPPGAENPIWAEYMRQKPQHHQSIG